MKNFLIFALLVFALTSCSSDSLELNSENLLAIEKSELLVTVTHLTWSDLQSDLNCTGGGTQSISYLPNARVDVYTGDLSLQDEGGVNAGLGLTDANGAILFRDMEPGQYTVIVDSPYGRNSRTLYTQLNKRAAIEFSF
jgi:hypothetical protein